MPAFNPPNLRQTALASGLVSKQELDEAVEALRLSADAKSDDKKGAGKPGEAASDRKLAEKLVDLGYINRWQAEQLLNGRVKWNLGPYRIVDAIGQGGMGQVFKAEHTIMQRIVAIKVLPLSRSTPDSINNFRREIQAQARLDHENLVRAYDAGQDGNVHFLVTEYVPGYDLRRLIKRQGRLDMYAAASIISQAAKGLEHAHGRGLIHRDIKPGNLLVTPEGGCKVSDLGLAGFLDDESDERKKKTVGTADYLSPEQIMTPDKLTPACDIYSLGCTLYYAVTGKVPFPGGTTRDKARKHCHEQPIDPRRLNADLAAGFVDFMAEMMIKPPADRVQTASEVVEGLAPWAGAGWTGPQGGSEPAKVARAAGSAPPPVDNIALNDTKPLPEIASEERPDSFGPHSETTHPVGSASEETMPLYDYPRAPPIPHGFSRTVVIAIALSVTAAVALVAAILIKAIF